MFTKHVVILGLGIAVVAALPSEVSAQAPTPGQTGQGKVQVGSPEYRQSLAFYKVAVERYAQKNYPEAEHALREAIRLYESQPGVTSPHYPWHTLLGKILLKLDKDEEAFKEIAAGWHPGWNERQDLLVAIAGSRRTSPNRNAVEFGALSSYLDRRSDVVLARLGSTQADLPKFTENQTTTAAIAWLLYGADPSVGPEEALDCFAEAEALFPDLPQTAFLRGDAYLRLGQVARAKPYLEAALKAGKGRLREMATEALAPKSAKERDLARAERYLQQAKALIRTEAYFNTSAEAAAEQAILLIERAGGDSARAKGVLSEVRQSNAKTGG